MPEERKNRENFLPLVEFAYINSIHSSSGKVPFGSVEGERKILKYLQEKVFFFEYILMENLLEFY